MVLPSAPATNYPSILLYPLLPPPIIAPAPPRIGPPELDDPITLTPPPLTETVVGLA